MAMAERFLREHFGPEVQDHRIYAIVSDGDLMEGVASEAASLAGHLGLGRLVYLYDDNTISLDGPTSLSFDEDVSKRFEAYGWHVDEVARRQRPRGARAGDRPRGSRGGAPVADPRALDHRLPARRTSRARARRTARRSARTRCALTKEAMGWDPDAHFARSRRRLRAHRARSRAARRCRPSGTRAARLARGGRGARRRMGRRPGPGRPLPGLDGALPPATGGKTRSPRASPARSRWPPSRAASRR